MRSWAITRRRLATLTGGLALLLALSVESTHGIRTNIIAGYILWNGEQAFIVVGNRQQGWRRSLAALGRDIIISLLPAATPSQDSKPSLTLIRVTAQEVQCHVAEDAVPGVYMA